MTDEEQKYISISLKELVQSNGGEILLKHIDSEIKDGWEKFIELPVDKKTSKTAYDHQARYKVLKDLKEWISSEIKLGE